MATSDKPNSGQDGQNGPYKIIVSPASTSGRKRARRRNQPYYSRDYDNHGEEPGSHSDIASRLGLERAKQAALASWAKVASAFKGNSYRI